MRTPFIIFARAIGLYLLFTVPAIAVPFMYAYSAFLAIVFGSTAGLTFICLYLFISKTDISFSLKRNLLFLFVLTGVALSYSLIGFFDAADQLWSFNLFLVFPAIAVISGWASLFISRNAIREQLDPEATEIQLLLKP
jgi:hypothetical protein